MKVWDGSQWVDTDDAGKVLQVVSTTKTDTFSTTSTSFTDVTGLSATITPSSATSKILIYSFMNWGSDPSYDAVHVRMRRDSTDIFIGDAAGSRTRATFYSLSGNNNRQLSHSPIFLDSPSTTSAVTYAVQTRAYPTGQTVALNRSKSDADNAGEVRSASSIVVMEIAG